MVERRVSKTIRHMVEAAEWLADGGLDGSNPGLYDAGMMVPAPKVNNKRLQENAAAKGRKKARLNQTRPK